MINQLKAWLGFFPTFGGVPRSSKWREVRKQHLMIQNVCQVCTTTKDLDCHHILPYFLRPDLELESSNLITLCTPHHLLFGHFMNYKSYNKDVVADAQIWFNKIDRRP